jgi:ribonuclease BN (tRNA processing enzyme)
MPSQRTYRTLGHGDVLVWEDGDAEPRAGDGEASSRAVTVRCFRNTRHPNGGVLNFRIEHGGRSVVLATDVEGTEGVNGDLVEFTRGTDLLIHDAQYTDEEYDEHKRGWGHSTWRMATDVAWRAQARRLVLFHHDPEHDDSAVEEIERAAREKFPRCIAACEGLEIRL